MEQSLLVDITNSKVSVENFENKLKLVKKSDDIVLFLNKIFEKSLNDKTSDEKFQSILFYIILWDEKLRLRNTEFKFSIKKIIESNKSDAFFSLFLNVYEKTKLMEEHFLKPNIIRHLDIQHALFLDNLFYIDQSSRSSIYDNNFLEVFLKKIQKHNLTNILDDNPRIILPINKHLVQIIKKASIQEIKQVNQQVLIDGINNLFNKNNTKLHNNSLLAEIDFQKFNDDILKNNKKNQDKINDLILDNNLKLDYFETLNLSIPTKCLVSSSFNYSISQEKQKYILNQYLDLINEKPTTLFQNAIINNNNKSLSNLIAFNIPIINDNKSQFEIARQLSEKLINETVLNCKKQMYYIMKNNGLNTNTTAFFYGLNGINHKNDSEYTQEFNNFYIQDIGEENWNNHIINLKNQGTLKDIIQINTKKDFHFNNWFNNYTWKFTEKEKKSLEQFIELNKRHSNIKNKNKNKKIL